MLKLKNSCIVFQDCLFLQTQFILIRKRKNMKIIQITQYLTISLFLLLGLTANAQDSIYVKMNDEIAQVGTEVCIDIKVENYEDVEGAQFSINWDFSKLSFKEVTNFNADAFVDEFAFGLNKANKGILTCAILSGFGATVDDGSTLFTLCFDVVGPSGYTPVSFSEYTLATGVFVNNLSYDLNTVQGGVHITASDDLTAYIDNCNSDIKDGIGTLHLTAEGGVAPYQLHLDHLGTAAPIDVMINNAGETAIVDLDTADLWVYTLSDSDGNSLIDTIDVIDSSKITTEVFKKDLTCFGDETGEIKLFNIVGAESPYFVLWSNSTFNTTDLEGLSGGTYSFRLSEFETPQCYTEGVVTINEPEELDLGSDYQVTSCSPGNDGSINLNISGGTIVAGSDYQVNWSTGDTATALSLLEDIIYTITVTDDNDCSIVEIYDFRQKAPIVGIEVIAPISCNGSMDGVLGVEIIEDGNDTNYSYEWNNGSTDVQISNLQEDGYSVTITDGLNCVTDAEFLLTEPDLISALYEKIDMISGVPGQITVLVFGGTPPYLYSIDDGQTYQESDVFDNLMGGAYLIQVTDANGCELLESISVNILVGVDDIHSLATHISPNPVLDILRIDNLNEIDGVTDITIYSIDGRRIKSIEYVGESTLEISMSDLDAGTYYLRVFSATDSHGVLVEKL